MTGLKASALIIGKHISNINRQYFFEDIILYLSVYKIFNETNLDYISYLISLSNH